MMVLLQRRAAALFLFAFIFLMPISHAHSREKTDIKTLVIVSPYPERSVLTKGLQEAAESLEGVTVRNLETLYGYDTRRINGDAERKMMREHSRVVFIFPTHWFNITPMMKAWLNETWGVSDPVCGRERRCLLSVRLRGKLYLRAGRQDRGIARGCVFTDEGKRPARRYDVASSLSLRAPAAIGYLLTNTNL
jgi:glutathione-regulated potassium-efflux system ancillary protein KefF